MILIFLIIIKSGKSRFGDYSIITHDTLKDYALTNFQNAISFRETKEKDYKINDPFVAKLESKGDKKFVIRLGKNYLYRENEGKVFKGKDLEEEDEGFYFQIYPVFNIGFQLANKDACLEMKDFGGPLDGYEVVANKCTDNFKQVFLINPINVSKEVDLPNES